LKGEDENNKTWKVKPSPILIPKVSNPWSLRQLKEIINGEFDPRTQPRKDKNTT